MVRVPGTLHFEYIMDIWSRMQVRSLKFVTRFRWTKTIHQADVRNTPHQKKSTQNRGIIFISGPPIHGVCATPANHPPPGSWLVKAMPVKMRSSYSFSFFFFSTIFPKAFWLPFTKKKKKKNTSRIRFSAYTNVDLDQISHPLITSNCNS